MTEHLRLSGTRSVVLLNDITRVLVVNRAHIQAGNAFEVMESADCVIVCVCVCVVEGFHFAFFLPLNFHCAIRTTLLKAPPLFKVSCDLVFVLIMKHSACLAFSSY